MQIITSLSFGFSCILLLKNGYLASGSYDNMIRMWNLESGECVKALNGHFTTVNRLITLDSGEIVSCSYDNTIKIWDANDGRCVKTLVGHSHWVKSIQAVNGSNTLVSCSIDGTLKTWDLRTGVCLNTISDQNRTPLQDLIFI